MWGDVDFAGSVWLNMSEVKKKSILANHIVSDTLFMYYRTLCGLQLDEQTYVSPNNGWGGDFTNYLNIDASAYEFLVAANINKGLQGPPFAPDPASILTTPSDGDLKVLFHGTGDEPDPKIPVAANYNIPSPNDIHGEGNPRLPYVKRLKDEWEGIFDGNNNVTFPYKGAPFKIFKCLLQSGAFQSHNIAWGASATKEYDRVFTIPIDVDAFVIDASKQKAGVIEFYANNSSVNILETVPTGHPAWDPGKTLYKLNYSSVSPGQPVGNPQDFVFADQFFAQFALVETPGAGEGLQSFTHGFSNSSS